MEIRLAVKYVVMCTFMALFNSYRDLGFIC